MKAYSLNAAKFQRLQQTWMSWPWPHLYEHPRDVGMLVVHRRFENDDWLFWGKLEQLTTKSLVDIQTEIDHYQTAPVEQIFKRQLWLARRSTPLRRLFWWLTFHVSGKKKCKRLGTYFLSTISGQGAEIQEPPSMLTSGFTYGPIDNAGQTRLTITYDHRLMDGHHVADILSKLEQTLHDELLGELRQLSAAKSAA